MSFIFNPLAKAGFQLSGSSDWNSISGKPTSSPSQIDNAVAQAGNSVPYTGASANVDLNAKNLSNIGIINDQTLNSSIDVNNRVLFDPFGIHSIEWASRVLVDLVGANSLDWLNRELLDSSNQEAMDWNQRFLVNTNGYVIFDWQQSIGRDQTSVYSLDFNLRTLVNNTGNQVSLDWQNDLLLSSGQNSLDWMNRILIDGSGSISSLDWNNRHLSNATPFVTLDWQQQYLYDYSANISLQWGNRQLFDGTGNISLQWGNRFLRDSSATSSVEWDNRVLKNSFGGTVIDWQNHHLVNNGSIRIDWVNDIVSDSTGNQSINWDSRTLIKGGNNLLDWNNGVLNDNSGLASLFWGNFRQLIANNGSTIMFDWATVGTLDAKSNQIINVVDPINPQDVATKNYVDTHPPAITPWSSDIDAAIHNLNNLGQLSFAGSIVINAGDTQVSIGQGASTGDGDAIAIGVNATAHNTNSMAIGPFTDATGAGALAFMCGASTNGDRAIAIGFNANAGGQGSIIIGGTGDKNHTSNNREVMILTTNGSTDTIELDIFSGIADFKANSIKASGLNLPSDLGLNSILVSDGSGNASYGPQVSTDGTLSANLNTLIPTQQAIKTYVDNHFPKVVASTFEKNETGTDANVLTYTTGASDEFLTVLVATDVSALTGTSIAVTVTWKDSNNSTATSTLTVSGVGDGTINIPINAFTGTNVVISTAFIGVSTSYKISAVITRLL